MNATVSQEKCLAGTRKSINAHSAAGSQTSNGLRKESSICFVDSQIDGRMLITGNSADGQWPEEKRRLMLR